MPFDQTFTAAAGSPPFKIAGGETITIDGTFEGEVFLCVSRQFIGAEGFGQPAGFVHVDSEDALAVFDSNAPIPGRWNVPATVTLPALRASPSVAAYTQMVVTVTGFRSGAVRVQVA